MDLKLLPLLVFVVLLIFCAQAGASVERLTNGGFESGLTGWEIGPYNASVVAESGAYGVTAREGSHFLDVRLSDYTKWPKTTVSQFTVIPTTGAWYEATAWVYAHLSDDPGAKQASLTVDWGDGTIDRIPVSVTDAWTQIGWAHQAVFASPTFMTVYVELYGDPLVSGDFVLFDDVSFIDYSVAVPEPTSLGAVGLLTAYLIGFARRRNGRRP